MTQSYLTIRLQLLGFSAEERDKLDSILAIAEARMNNMWQLDSTMNADVVLVPDASQLPLQETRPCIYYKETDQEVLSGTADNVWSLDVDDFRVPRIWQLTKVFNEVAEALATQPEPAPAVTEVPESEPEAVEEVVDEAADSNAVEAFAPADQTDVLMSDTQASDSVDVAIVTGADVEDTGLDSESEQVQVPLLHVLQPDPEAGEQRCMLLRFVSGEAFYIDVVSDLYYSREPIEELADCFRAQTEFTIQAVPEQTLQAQAERSELVAEPLTHLRWFVALNAPCETMREKLQAQTVKLKRWPDLGLPGCRPLIRLAAFMQSNEASIETVAEKTGTPVEKVCAFIHACDQENLVVMGTAEAIHEKPVEADFKMLLSRISNRINA